MLFRNDEKQGNQFTAVPIEALGKNGPPVNDDGTSQTYVGLAGSKDLDDHFVATAKKLGKIEPEKAEILYESFCPFLTLDGQKKVRSLLGIRKTKANGEQEVLAAPEQAEYELTLVKLTGEKRTEVGTITGIKNGTTNDVIRGLNELLADDGTELPLPSVA